MQKLLENLGKVVIIKGKVTQFLVNSTAEEFNIPPEEVTVEHLRESMKKDCTEDEFVSLELE